MSLCSEVRKLWEDPIWGNNLWLLFQRELQSKSNFKMIKNELNPIENQLLRVSFNETS